MEDITWDYLIIGGGLAGLHLARRLAENYPHKSICIVEKYDYLGGRVYTEYPKSNGMQPHESGAGRIHTSHRLVHEYLKRYGLKTIPIHSSVQHRQINEDGNVEISKNQFEPLIHKMILGLPDSIKKNLHKYTLRQAFEETYRKPFVQRVFDQYGYRAETETLRADVAVKNFNDFMASNSGFSVVAGGLSQLPIKLAAELVEKGVVIMKGIEITNFKKKDGVLHLTGKTSTGNWNGRTHQLILAMPRNAISKLPEFKNNWLVKSTKTEPLLRIYALFPVDKKGPWFAGLPKVTTNDPLRYVIPYNEKSGLIMVSYTDGLDTKHWRNVPKEERRAEIMMRLRRLFHDRNIPDPIAWYFHPWDDGCTYWLPYPNGPKTVKTAIEKAYRPLPAFNNLFVCGESWSDKQAWMEGAIESSENLFKKYL